MEEKAEEETEQRASWSKYCIPKVVTHKYGVTERPNYLKKKFIKVNKYYKHKQRYNKIWISCSLNLFFSALLWSCRNFHKNINLSWNICLCVLANSIYIQNQHKPACCRHTLNWKSRRKIFSYNFLSPLHYSFKVISAECSCFLPMPWLYSDKYLLTQVISDCGFHVLIKLLC
jgi:hypothetical protein